MIDWIQEHDIALTWLALFSAVTFILTLIAVPVIAVRVPPDYFVSRRRQQSYLTRAPAGAKAVIKIVRSVIGALLLLAGLLMLVLPGQGILTILFGLILLEVPGTYQLGRWIIRRPPVWRSVNWLRQRAGKSSLILHDE